MGRPLNPDETALWARVMASVRPLRAVVIHANIPDKPAPGPDASPPRAARERQTKTVKPTGGIKLPPHPTVSAGRLARPAAASSAPANTLDGGWDKRLARGAVIPDSSIDLHGHTLASAHRLLDEGLGRAIARGDRVLLLVTGKPPRPESERPHARGAIRAAITDWLAISRHAGGIAAVRGAHPRHGGQGALYIILRRER